MKLLKKLLVLNLSLFGTLSTPLDAATAVETQEAEWAKYTYEENGFSVDLPKKPTHTDQSIDVPKTTLKIHYSTYVSEPSEAAVYVVSVWHYPKDIDMSRPEVNLKDGFQGMLSALPGSTVVSQNMNDFQGFKALEFLVKNEDIYFQGKLILVYNTLYQVFTVYKESEVEKMKDNYPRFIKSFKLLHPETNRADTAEMKAKKMSV